MSNTAKPAPVAASTPTPVDEPQHEDVGRQATIIGTTYTGSVVDVRFNQRSGQKETLVEWTDRDGQVQQRWFKNDEIDLA